MATTTHVTPEEYHTMKLIKENYIALYTNLSNPRVAVGQHETIGGDDDDDDALPYRAAVLGEDTGESTPDKLEILSLTKRGRTRLGALKKLLAHVEDKVAEAIDSMEKDQRKKGVAKGKRKGEESNGKSASKKGAVQSGRMEKPPASKTKAPKPTTSTEKTLAQVAAGEQVAKTKTQRTEKEVEDLDATESAHESEKAIEVTAVARGQKAAPRKTVPDPKKRK